MSLPAPPPPAGFRPRPEVALPDKFHLREDHEGLEISWRWFGLGAVFLVFFAIAWNSFLVFWYAMAVGGRAPWIMFVFPLIHVAVGVTIGYTAIAQLFNRTRIRVTFRDLIVDHAPLPWRGNRRVERAGIEQLYGKMKVSHGKNGTTTTYTLWMRIRDGKQTQLIGSGLEEEQILALEQKLEAALQIADVPVPGEIAR